MPIYKRGYLHGKQKTNRSGVKDTLQGTSEFVRKGRAARMDIPYGKHVANECRNAHETTKRELMFLMATGGFLGFQPLQAAPLAVYPQLQPVMNYVPATVQLCVSQQPVLNAVQAASCCWIHRPPGDLRQIPPPPPGRPAQWVQWSDGYVGWLPRPMESG